MIANITEVILREDKPQWVVDYNKEPVKPG